MLFEFEELFIAVSYDSIKVCDSVGSPVNFEISSFGRRTFALAFSTLLCTFRSVLVEKFIFRNSESRAMFCFVHIS